ncbi:hypothetical protein [Xanthomonas hortorum]|uniref:hypothetical protein n=1 Tax=Xanthomonas hortorum TaxID=56454 RepID=UPI001F3110FA|nr:hypothetical protein [Xanthomonas hortorum]MCE4358564.1 hypothetical protein [Xanthomonas hortorum pv. taraxaci]
MEHNHIGNLLKRLGMRPISVTSATPGAAIQDQTDVQAERGARHPWQQGDPQANIQLTQQLPRAPVRAAQVRAARRPLGVQIANAGRQAARFAASAVAGPAEAAALDALHAPATAAYEYAKGHLSWKKNAGAALAPALAYAVVMATLSTIEHLADWYLQAQPQDSVNKSR